MLACFLKDIVTLSSNNKYLFKDVLNSHGQDSTPGLLYKQVALISAGLLERCVGVNAGLSLLDKQDLT